MRSMGLTLVLGGARSGKSRHAEQLALATGLAPVYLATAQGLDDEMARRIAAHRARRGPVWRTVEEPLDLTGALGRECAPERIVLVDCLTLWLSNLMIAGRPVEAESARLLEALPGLPGPAVLVSNEVGQGIVPDDYHPVADVISEHDLKTRLARIRSGVQDRVNGMPSHQAFIDRHCAARPQTMSA